MEIVEDYVFPQGRGWNWPEYLIIHETANPGATALNHVNYWASGEQGGEAHYVADWTGIVYHTTPDDRATWNVGGNANSWTVGIELCHATNQADFEKVWRTGVEFAAWYLNSRGWGIDRMMSHDQANRTWATYSDHTDPIGYFEEFGKSWAQFAQEVEQEMEGEQDMATPEEVWGYDWQQTAPQGNMYNCVVGLYKMVEAMERKVDALSAKVDKISVGTTSLTQADINAIKKAVNDDAAKRMQN